MGRRRAGVAADDQVIELAKKVESSVKSIGLGCGMCKRGWFAMIAVVVACGKPADKPAADDKPPSAMDKAPADKEHHRKHEDRREPVVANAPPLALEVSVGGKPATWSQDAFDKVAKYTKGNDGEARDVWSLRELAHQLVGPNARVTTVTGEDGTKQIDAAAWSDPSKTPLLHTTRRGTLKYRWADGDGKWGESAVKDVSRIEIAP